ncbi:MAG: bifunctional glutamate--cysteine ligase GshA/glutathione synthetase GshB [Clostridium sp.]|uniref:bifunctional glutamate--cysteine ligase GshA/glutathione synthetase GshB n=1 Tax=Clostridium sp. TaxID=1506 RepID=UPI002FC8ED27
MLNIYKSLFNKEELLEGNFGIEREALRVDGNGYLALTKHPKDFGEKIENPYITTDFSESQVEMVTPIFSSLKDTHDFLEVLYDIVANSLEGEYLWPQSMPCYIKDEGAIPIADFGDSIDGTERYNYRASLLKRYGGKKQLISGIHYNFSFKDEFIRKIYKHLNTGESFKVFKNNFYLKITRNYLRYRWFLIYLLGAAPVIHESYKSVCSNDLKLINSEDYSTKGAISFRNTECGYENKVDLYPSYKSVESHIKSVISFIEKDYIDNSKELYSQIRLKAKDNTRLFESLLEDGIDYLEVRSIDINPFEKTGISYNDLRLIHLFILYTTVKEEKSYKMWQEEALYNQRLIARHGCSDVFLKKDGEKILAKDYLLEVISEIEEMNQYLELKEDLVIDEAKNKIINPSTLPSVKVIEESINKGYLHSNISLAKDYKESSYKNRFKMVGYEDLELSTQILMKEAIKRGIKVDIIDRTENFITLSDKNKIEYVKQATETSLDSFATILMMENKVVTKKVLRKHNIRVPDGFEYTSIDDALGSIYKFTRKPIVIKPKGTNFGIGISIFPDGANKDDIKKAFEIAFSKDNTVLVEEFIKGKEFRFLVVEDEAIGVLNRVPANVIGNGVDSITTLVEEKNKSYLRSKGYKTPLEKIEIDKHVELFLAQFGKTPNYVPAMDEVVYLRENSNISTGGDSIDYTDEMPQRFKDIAVKASKAVDATICGVDLMIEDFKDENSNYAIIELNFNPAIHIHSFPYKGVERKIAEKVLKALGFIK